MLFNNGFHRLYGFSSLLNISKLLIRVIGEIRCSFNLARSLFFDWLTIELNVVKRKSVNLTYIFLSK